MRRRDMGLVEQKWARVDAANTDAEDPEAEHTLLQALGLEADAGSTPAALPEAESLPQARVVRSLRGTSAGRPSDTRARGVHDRLPSSPFAREDL